MKRRYFLYIIFCIPLVIYAQTNESLINDYLAKAQTAYSSSDYDNAIAYYQKLLELQKEKNTENSTEVADTYSWIGYIYYLKSDFDNALMNYEKALKIREKRLGKDNKDVAFLYSTIGACFYNMGNFDNSYFYLNTALSIYETIDSSDLEIAKILINIGGIFEEKQDYDNTLFFYKRAASIFQKYGALSSEDAQRRSFADGTRGINRGSVQTDFSLDEMNEKQLSKSGELSKYGILHFACHGYFDKSLAEMSSVLFSEVSGKLTDSSQDDGYLTIGEAAVLNLNAEIVCLSACETGLGEVKAGDGIIGLSRAFVVAGAKHVGASLWCVDDSATAKFMSSMYKKVTKGMDYVTAYQKTKAEFRKDEDFSHPYYWSAFVLYK